MKTKYLKNYSFSFEDKEGNEIQKKHYLFYNIKEARVFASKLLGNSMIYDLHKITVKRVI
jgi:hypothetical protein